jgi:hypothetical protein
LVTLTPVRGLAGSSPHASRPGLPCQTTTTPQPHLPSPSLPSPCPACPPLSSLSTSSRSSYVPPFQVSGRPSTLVPSRSAGLPCLPTHPASTEGARLLTMAFTSSTRSTPRSPSSLTSVRARHPADVSGRQPADALPCLFRLASPQGPLGQHRDGRGRARLLLADNPLTPPLVR